MKILRFLFDWFFDRDDPDDGVDFKNSQGILIRPDGSWVIAPQQKPAQAQPPVRPMINTPPIIGKDMNWSTRNEPRLDVIDFPPDYFPHAKELHSKLEQCLELDIISSCVHKQSQNSVYILAIELPCTTDHSQNMVKFKQFIRAMEELYRFKTVQQERIYSTVCDQKSYLVVFEYDPRQDIVKNLKGE